MRPFLNNLKNDALLSRVMRASGVLFSANTVSLGLSVLQGALITRLLGPESFGLIRVIMAYVSTINSILSFRMSELVVRYGGEYIEKREFEKASAVFKLAGLVELVVSVLAFLVVLVTAAFAESYLAKTTGTAWMFSLFALALLANFNMETSTGILQVTGRIKHMGTINLIQSMATFLILLAAFFYNGSTLIVLSAYLLGKVILGLGMYFTAQSQARRVLGNQWGKNGLSTLGSTREMVRFAVSSNISATIIKVFRESELLWVAYFLSTSAAGYYSVAYTIASFLTIPADPLISTTFPEINTLVVQKAWARLKSFLRKISVLSLLLNLTLGALFIIFGRTIISIYAGEKFISAYPALVALTIGLVFNYTLFWNRPLLLALGLPEFPIYITLIAGVIKLGLTFSLIPKYGITAAGALLSFYYIFSVGGMVIRGWREVNARQSQPL
jgi:O-antigen/teichoic acid export membrane protein